MTAVKRQQSDWSLALDKLTVKLNDADVRSKQPILTPFSSENDEKNAQNP